MTKFGPELNVAEKEPGTLPMCSDHILLEYSSQGLRVGLGAEYLPWRLQGSGFNSQNQEGAGGKNNLSISSSGPLNKPPIKKNSFQKVLTLPGKCNVSKYVNFPEFHL